MNVEDVIGIQQLCYAYAIHVDTGDIDRWADLFADGAPLDEREWGEGLKTGPEEIKAYGVRLVAEVDFMFHHVTNMWLGELGDTTASGTVFSIVESKGKTFPRSRFQPVYEDEYVKVDGRWKFASRTLHKVAEAEQVPEPAQPWSRD